jgi:hypothetical protein
MDLDPNQSSMVLANRIRNCIGEHMKNFGATEYQEMLASAIMALYVETARLKHLSVATNEVDPEDFDRVFMEGVKRHFEDHSDRPETIN